MFVLYKYIYIIWSVHHLYWQFINKWCAPNMRCIKQGHKGMHGRLVTHKNTHTHTRTYAHTHSQSHTHTTDQCFCKILLGSWTDDWSPPGVCTVSTEPGAWCIVGNRDSYQTPRLSGPTGIKLENRGTRDRREEPIRAKDGQQSRWAD